MILKRLTDKQRAVFDKIVKNPCSMEKLGKHFGISRQAIHCRVNGMRRKGYLEPTGEIKATPEGIHSIIERLSL